jgi:hypothetical protein
VIGEVIGYEKGLEQLFSQICSVIITCKLLQNTGASQKIRIHVDIIVAHITAPNFKSYLHNTFSNFLNRYPNFLKCIGDINGCQLHCETNNYTYE